MIRVLFSGVDTLEASFRGTLSLDLQDTLEAAKVKAQGNDLPEPLSVGRMEFMVAGKGLARWRYLLQHEDIHLRLSASSRVPTVSARLLACGLVAYGHEPLYELASDLAKELGARPDGLSRIDLAVDFQGFEPTVADMTNAVCAAPFRPIYPNLEHPETFQFGRGDLVVRVYNKSREIQNSGKGWFRAVWRQSEDYDESADVWRFEAQLRRPILRELGCVDADVAFQHLDRLLGYALLWCELRAPSGENRSRWARDPRWQALSEAAFAGMPLPRVRAERYAASFRRTVPQALGLLVSGAAHLGVYDFERALDLWKREARSYIDKSGKEFPERVQERRRRLVG